MVAGAIPRVLRHSERRRTEASEPSAGCSRSSTTEILKVGATFQVEAASIEAAGAIGVRAFKSALKGAGIVGQSGTYRVRPLDEVDTFSVARVNDDDREAVFA